MNVDVVLLLYNRPDHTKRVIDSLFENNVENISVFIDYPKTDDDSKKQDSIYDVINRYDKNAINLIKRTNNIGLARSVRSAMNHSFSHGADAAILLEDDCVLKKGGFDFFKEGLIELKDNKQIRSLCGYTFPSLNFIFEPDSDVLLLSRFSTWGWATWADRWEQYETDLKKLVQFAEMARLRIDDFAEDIAQLCKSPKYLNGEVDIWSINWILLHYLTSTFAAYPREAVIENIGLDGSGLNCEVTDVFDGASNHEFINEYNWKKLQYYPENETIIRNFMAENGLKTYPKP